MDLFFQITPVKSTRIDVLVVNILNEHGHDISRGIAQQLIENSKVKANGVVQNKPSSKFEGNLELSIDFDKTIGEKKINDAPVDLHLEVVYDDEDIAVINKPSGIAVHEGAGISPEPTLVNGLKFLFGNNLSSIDEARPGIVHRIDKDTSGLIIIAKNNISHQILADSFKKHEVVKKYIAFTWGVPMMREFTIDTLIGRSNKNRQKMAVVDNEENGKRAISHFKILDNYQNIASKIECRIETGRTHQIRVHLAYNKTPIIGDPLYTRSRVISGEQEFFGTFKRQALHSACIGFNHPIKKQWMEFSSDMPFDMLSLEKLLLKYK